MAPGSDELSASRRRQRQHPQQQSEHGREAGAEGAAASVVRRGTVPRGQAAAHRVWLTRTDDDTLLLNLKDRNVFLKIRLLNTFRNTKLLNV